MPLVFFVLGILFSELFLPLLKKVGELIVTALEKKEAKLSESINESNIKMKRAAASADEPKYQIGFAVPACDDEEEEDEDEL